MKAPFFSSRSLLPALLALLLSACGSKGIMEVPSTTQPQNDNSFDGGTVTDDSGDYAAYSAYFSTTGTNPTIALPSLNTDTKLTVKINAEAATTIQTDVSSNFAAEYHCAQYQVTLQAMVNGSWQTLNSQVTGYLSVAGTGGCDGSVASQTLDFSPYMSPGHGAVRFQVTTLKYDFYCQEYNKCQQIYQQYYYWPTSCYAYSNPATKSYVCPGKTVYASHTVNGTIQVQVNGTSFVNH